MNFSEALGLHFVNTFEIDSWRKAKKTKGILAKPIQNILTDMSVLAKFLLDTLEGQQTLKATSMVCLGVTGEVWQQKKKNLFQQYNVVDINDEGWLVCEPKPDAERDAVEVTPEMCDENGVFSIVAQWGKEMILDSKQFFVQTGKLSDIVCRNPSDYTDVWIVRRKEFDATQEFLPPSRWEV